MEMSSMTRSGRESPAAFSARAPLLATRTRYPFSRRIPASRVRLVGLSSTTRISAPVRTAPPSAPIRCPLPPRPREHLLQLREAEGGDARQQLARERRVRLPDLPRQLRRPLQ